MIRISSFARRLRKHFTAQKSHRSRNGVRRFEPLEAREMLATDLVITEFMASNDMTLLDEDGASSDWIEIHNPTASDVALSGWHLTDDRGELDKWTFPEFTLQGGGYAVIFASGNNRRPDSLQLRTDFVSISDNTFLVDLPDGQYDVEILSGDTQVARDQADVYLQGVQVDTLQTAAGQFVARSFTTEVNAAAGGQLAVRIVDTGGATGKSVINALVVTPTAGGDAHRFDFGVDGSPVEPGFTAVTPDDVYAAATGYGWQSTETLGGQQRNLNLHTSYKLSASGEYVGLVQPDMTIVSEYSPSYPPQITDVSYGIPAGGTEPSFLETPTPGAANSLARAAEVEFDRESGLFSDAFALTLSTSTDLPGATIHFTTDRSEPTAESPVYTEPLQIDETTYVQAIAVAPGFATSTIRDAWFMKIGDDVQGFSSDLPVVVLDNFGVGFVPGTDSQIFQFHGMTLFEPDETSGRTSLAGDAALTTRAGLRVRGSSTGGAQKQSFRLETWDEDHDDKDIAPLGLPSESDWILYAPFDYDRALINNPFIYEISNQVGRYAVRTRFVEVFHNKDGGDVSADDYVGLYSFMESIKVGPDRVDIAALDPSDNTEPDISGGWLVKRDRNDPGDRGFPTDAGTMLFADPDEDDVTPEQQEWVRNEFNAMYASTSDFDPDTGYQQYIDVDSWIDHHILNVLPMNVDAFRLSGYLFKDRGEKWEYGPIWDFDRAMGSTDSRDDDPFRWEGPPDSTIYFDHDSRHPWWGRLFEDPNFMQRWTDRWFELRQDILSDENLFHVIDSMAAEISEAASRNFEQWTAKRPRSFAQEGFKSGQLDSTFQGEINHLKAWLAARTEWIDSQFLQPPDIEPNQTYVPQGQPIIMSADVGTVYYTTDQSDPRLPDGSISPNAIAYNPTVVFSDSDDPATYLVPTGAAAEDGWQNPGFDDSAWNAGQASLGFETGVADLSLDVPGGFTVYQAHATSPITTLAAAKAILLGNNIASDITVTGVPVINYLDGGDDGHFDGSVQFPNGGGDNFAIKATATLMVNATGDYTFGINSDEGSELTIDGNSIIIDPARHLPRDRFVTTFLTEGTHDLEFIMWENSEGSTAELFVAPGTYEEFNDQFQLLGNVAPVDYTAQFATDVQSDMHGASSSVYLRIPFDLPDAAEVQRLFLNVQYDDGFVAYINGVEVARRNAPETLSFDASSTAAHPDEAAILFETIDASAGRDALMDTGNILAIHGLNRAIDNPDFLMGVRLDAAIVEEPLRFTEPVHYVARVLAGDQWSAPSHAMFIGESSPDDARQLVITEINFNPHDPTAAERAVNSGFDNDDFEFIEILNQGSHTVDLDGIHFADGVDFTFPDGPSSILDPGHYILVARNEQAFEARYGAGLPVAGEFASGNLSNSGEPIELRDAFDQRIQRFEYRDSGVWPARADGQGSSLEVLHTAGDYNDGANWRASTDVGGSPGRAGDGPTFDIVINEVLTSGVGADADRVELHNTTQNSIDVGGWFVTDNPELLFKSQIDAGISIPAGGYLVLTQSHLGFGLDGDSAGTLLLISGGATPRFADQVVFDAANDDVSLARWPNGGGQELLVPMVSQSFGAANTGPIIGPAILSEVHYNPAALPTFSEDFDDGLADSFEPRLATWEISEGQYMVTPGTEQPDDTLALVPSVSVLSNRFTIDASVRTDSTSPFKKNAAIIFDYQSDTDFKFVSIHANVNKLRIGHRDASNWNFLAEVQPSPELDPDAELEVSVQIDGSRVTLFTDGKQRALFNFSDPLNDGQVGLGSKGGQAWFDNFVVTPLDDEAFEFVEILNTTAGPLDLSEWQLTGGIEITLPAGTVLPADGILVAVGFDPADSTAAANFRELFSADNSVVLVGPYTGRLNNAGETVKLVKPKNPSSSTGGLILVDFLNYAGSSPWPADANGNGRSLGRRMIDSFGGLPGNWAAQTPSPGSVVFARPGDMDGDGSIDTDDIEALVLALRNRALYEQTYGMSPTLAGDIDRDGDLDFDDIDAFLPLITAGGATQPVSAAGIDPDAGAEGAAAQPLITEFMASNQTTLDDEDGDSSDWIEVHNPNVVPMSLDGWYLTDDLDELDRWRLPDVVLDPDEYLVVFASGKNRAPEQVALRSDFHSIIDGTFLVDLPDGDYNVELTLGDIDQLRDDLEIYVQGSLVDALSLGAGQFHVDTYSAQVSAATGGQLSVRIVDTGGSTAKAVINGMVITPAGAGDTMQFDFGLEGSPVEPGFTAVQKTDTYSTETGYGWQEGVEPGGQDRGPERFQLHTNFKLGAGGEHVALVSPAMEIVSQYGPAGAEYPPQMGDMSYGITAAGERFFIEPTPGAANGQGVLGLVEDTAFSVDRGIFYEPFDVAITTDTDGATIRYTTDGSLPTLENGTVYDGPVAITTTTTLRAAAFKDDFAPTDVDTQTYVFPEHVLLQNGEGLGGAPWGHSASIPGGADADWAMDPAIVNHPDPETRALASDLLTLPTMSLSLNFDDMFGTGGIYIAGEGVEKPTSVELIYPDGSEGFQIDATVQIVGGSSTGRWKVDKLSMRLKFNNEMGDGDLIFPLFGEDATDSFDTLVLDARLNNVWHYGNNSSQRVRGQYVRDQFVADLQNATEGHAPHGQPMFLYINGLLWGIHMVHERPDDNFAAAYFGGDNEDYDVLKHNSTSVLQGTNENYATLFDLVNKDLTIAENYEAVADILDIEEFIDYMLVNYYVGNTDWAHQNWYASFNREDPNGKWRYHSWDAEHVLESVRDNAAFRNDNGGPTYLHHKLKFNEEYQLLFADHVQRHFFNGGLLTPEGATEMYLNRLNQVDRAVAIESARWGDNRLDQELSRTEAYARGTDWMLERDRLLTNYFPQRSDIVLEQLGFFDLISSTEAAQFNQHGGEVRRSFNIELSAPEGTIYYTTDGTDPRVTGGDVAPAAVLYAGAINLDTHATVKARVLHEGVWSALTEANFTVLSDMPLRITEINYAPHDANPVTGLGEENADAEQFEFVELLNAGAETIHLDGVKLVETNVDGDNQGIAFHFADQTLDPGERLVVVGDRSAFRSRYGTEVRLADGDDGNGGDPSEFGGRLSNTGEQLMLVDAGNAIISQFTYGKGDAWPDRTNGLGSSAEIVDSAADPGSADHWRPSSEFGGSPGAEGAGPDDRVIVNEILAHSEAPQEDQVELFNTTSEGIDVHQWYLSNSQDDYFKFRVDQSTVIPAGGYAPFAESQLGFGLDGLLGGELWVIEGDAAGRPSRFVDMVAFQGSDPGVSLGRWPNGDPHAALVPMLLPTIGAANNGPVPGDVIISEIHYNPAALADLRENFDKGTAPAFDPRAGSWNFVNGQYRALPPEPDAEDTISLLPSVTPLSNMSIAVTVNTPSDTPHKKNAAVIFDYQGEEDFKFALFNVGANRWRIGQRDASGWNFLAENIALPLVQTGVDIDIVVKLRGQVVTVFADGVQRVSHPFATPFEGGMIGLGAKGGEAFFDNVVVTPLNDPQMFEFVEVVNTAPASVAIDGWQLRGGVAFTFDAGLTLEPGQALAVVGFDPGEGRQGADFRALHNLNDAVVLVGPYAGALSNDGAAVTLLKPQNAAAAAGGGGLVLVDRVEFDALPPWAATADGLGHALHRRAVTAFGSDASSWVGGRPTPGTAVFVSPGDLDGNGLVDFEDVDAMVLALRNNARYETTYGIPAALAGDLDGDGDADYDDIDELVALVESEARAAARAAGESVTPDNWSGLADHVLEAETRWTR